MAISINSLSNLVFFLCCFVQFSATFPQQSPQQRHSSSFTENCADEHDKDFLSCTVSMVDCDVDLDKLLFSSSHSPPNGNGRSPSTSTTVFPGEAHDVRIEPFAKAMSKNSKDGQSQHQLLVDISWQTPPNNSTRALKAFLLEIDGGGGRKPICFLVNVSGTEWTAEKIAQSPRLHFYSTSLFSFAQCYEIELFSLPEKSAGAGASVHTRFTTPHNPNGPIASMPDICTKQSNQFASKWTAGFRHIYVHSAARVMQVEFVGAPPQYCFESYEVRLLDETGEELLYSGTVSVEDMERNGEGNLIIGQYNFTDLEYDRMYIPSVIPVERAADGRCLCPVFGIDPYDVKVVCSCVAADWRPVRMPRPDVVKVKPDPPPPPAPKPLPDPKPSIMWPLLIVLNALFLLLLCAFFIGYMRCRANGTIPRKSQFQPIRFVTPARKGAPDSDQQKRGGAGQSNHHLLASKSTASLAIRTNLGLGTVSTTSSMQTPLISADERDEASIASSTSSNALNVLIVYAHDDEAHEGAVVALAEFLRDIFHLNISLDRWDSAKIECNQVDWLSASVVGADKVVVLNSAGAWERYRAKIESSGKQLVKKMAPASDPLDHIFIAHIDMALQHHSVISARFNYTPTGQTLPMLVGHLQYILPDNIVPLVSAIFGQCMRGDGRLASHTLAACTKMAKLREMIEKMGKKCANEPLWLAKTHFRQQIDGGAEERKKSMDKLKVGEQNGEEEKLKSGGMENEEEEEEEEEQALSMAILEKKQREEVGVELPPSILALEKQQNSGKLDSGIFEWNGSEIEEHGCTATTSEAHEQNVVELNSEMAAEVGFASVKKAIVCHERIAAKISEVGASSEDEDKSAMMDSGLVADDPMEMESTKTAAANKEEGHLPPAMLAAV